MVGRLLGLAAVPLLVVASAVPAGASSASEQAAACWALLYLHSDQASNGAVGLSSSNLPSEPGVTEDFIFGGAAAGYDPNTFRKGSGGTVYDFLAGALTLETHSASGTAKLALAVTLGRRNPSAFAGTDLLAHLQTFHDQSGQPAGTYYDSTDAGSGFPTDAYTESLATLALVDAGRSVPADVITYLKLHENTDGSWDFFLSKDDSSNPGDTNSTAMVLMALEAAGQLDAVTSTRALAWLKAQQDADGGFPYASGSPSDPDSDAIVIQALLAVGQDPQGAAWSRNGHNPVSNALTFQLPSGAFYYAFPGESSSEAAANEPFTTGQIPAALEDAPLPVAARYATGRSLPLTCSAGAPATPTPTPKAGPAGLPPTSGPDAGGLSLLPLGAVAAGLVLVVFSQAARRRSTR